MKIKIINEDGLLDLIREKSGIPLKKEPEVNNAEKTTDKKIKMENSKENEIKREKDKSKDSIKDSHSKLKFGNLGKIKQEKCSPEKYKKNKGEESTSIKKENSIKLETTIKGNIYQN